MDAIILGFISGAIFGFTGAGGGILATPFLMYGLGIPVHQAIGITLLTLSLTSIFGLLQRFRTQVIDWQAGTILSISSTVASIIGTKMNYQMPAEILTILLAFFFVVISLVVWWDSSRIGVNKIYYAKQQRYIIFCLIGVVAGFLNGLLGISGGIIIVVALTLYLSFSMQQAASVSMLVIAISSSISATTHFYLDHNMDWEVATYFVSGSIIGIIISSNFSYKFSEKTLKRTVAAIIFLVGVSMFAKICIFYNYFNSISSN